MITIDGSYGEGGGQILRTSLALSLVTGKFFRIENIRAGRKKPGLMRQHLTCVNAAANIGKARVKGNFIGSQSLFFEPTTIKPGTYDFSVGTAGSTTLVLQSVLPALLVADGKSELTLQGGTHNPFAPPFDFLEKVFLPIIKKMGATVDAELITPGFYPAGGGKYTVTVEPVKKLNSIDLIDRGHTCAKFAQATVAKLPLKICEIELNEVCKKLKWDRLCTKALEVHNSRGPGNIITLQIACENITELFTGFGEKSVRAEHVAKDAINQAKKYLTTDAPVGRYLADQLIIPMAMAGGGKFRTLPLSRHSTTNIDIVKMFLDVDVTVTKQSKDVYEVDIKQIEK